MEQNKKKKKVLFAITKANWGGAQRYVFDLATHLPKDAYNVSVVSQKKGTLIEKLHKENIRTLSVPHLERDISFLKEVAVFFSLIKILRRERPDVFHINSSKIGGLGALAGQIVGIPRVIFTAHGWAHTEDRGIIARTVILFFHYLTILFSHTTIAVSHTVKDQITPSFLRKKITVIHNGIATPLHIKKEEELRAFRLKNNIPDDAFIVGTISELHKNKGLSYAIDALPFTPKDIHFIVMGEGEEREHLTKKIKESRLEKRVHLLGHVPEASSYLPLFDIFLLSSTKEGFPYALLEAGAASLPVIATKVGGIPELIHEKESGILIPPRNPKEIGAALSFMKEHKDKAVSFGKALNTKVREVFSLTQMVERTEKLY